MGCLILIWLWLWLNSSSIGDTRPNSSPKSKKEKEQKKLERKELKKMSEFTILVSNKHIKWQYSRVIESSSSPRILLLFNSLVLCAVRVIINFIPILRIVGERGVG